MCDHLHDISAVVAPGDMLAYATKKGWHVDESERKHPFLLHQRVSKTIMSNKEARLNALRQALANTDYKAIKTSEGCASEDWDEIRPLRHPGVIF